ncbi:SIS domain-containing protein [Sulfurisphaera ohwakuensis]|uniref:SIS domain-containing protein n=1 Tax=Sulfurisphaera ohwakuensis TaxID=69656 RepID=UPI0036F2BD2A
MNYIKLLEEELNTNYQVDSHIQLDEAYIVGSGDSYASGLVIEGKSKRKITVLDPYEALEVNITKPTVIVSVSGKTRYNVILAKKLRSKGVKVIGITANSESPLAKEVNDVVILPYRPKAKLPGFLSFLMSLSALYSMFRFEEDKERVNKVINLDNSPFFIGKSENYGVAYFSSLKMAEVFGIPSNYERLELFMHSPIFSSRNRNIIILSSGDERENKLYKLIDFTIVEETGCVGAFCNIRVILSSIIYKMKRDNWNRIYFLEDEKILNISSEMIY